MCKITDIQSKTEALDKIMNAAKSMEGASLPEMVDFLNKARGMLHQVSPFKNEPIDFVKWVITDQVHANDYNPNSVAPPEMILLEHSIEHDGYTQPVVAWPDSDSTFEVVDGFHRTTVAKRSDMVRTRLQGYMPLVTIQNDNADRNDRIAATIRHNRARGKHNVNSMSDIVIELKKRNWSDDRVARELGMDADEVLRLCQVSGLAEVFADEEFSKSWDAGIFAEEDLEALSEDDI